MYGEMTAHFFIPIHPDFSGSEQYVKNGRMRRSFGLFLPDVFQGRLYVDAEYEKCLIGTFMIRRNNMFYFPQEILITFFSL